MQYTKALELIECLKVIDEYKKTDHLKNIINQIELYCMKYFTIYNDEREEELHCVSVMFDHINIFDMFNEIGIYAVVNYGIYNDETKNSEKLSCTTKAKIFDKEWYWFAIPCNQFHLDKIDLNRIEHDNV